MPKLHRFIYLLVLIPLIQPAFADSSTETPATPWYFGLGIGTSLLGINKSNLVNSFNAATSASRFSHDDFAFDIYAGYFLDRLLALEFGYAELGNVIASTSGSSTKLFNTYSFYIDTMMLHRYNKNAAIYAKIGAHFWDIGTTSGSTITNGANLMLGAGIELNIYSGTARSIRVEWTRYQFDKVYLNSSDTLTLNLLFRY